MPRLLTVSVLLLLSCVLLIAGCREQVAQSDLDQFLAWADGLEPRARHDTLQTLAGGADRVAAYANYVLGNSAYEAATDSAYARGWNDPRVAALMWGPLVLAADLGEERQRGRGGDSSYTPPTIPVFVAADKPLDEWVKPVPDQPGNFHITGVGRDSLGAGIEVEANLVPFYRLHRRAYALYFDLFTPDEWEEKKAEYIAEQERLRRLEEATVAYAQPGEMQPERDFNYQGSEDSRVTRVLGRAGRRGGTWMSFDLPVDPQHAMVLVVTYYSDDRGRALAAFNILVDGVSIGSQEVTRIRPARLFDVSYPIETDLITGKRKVTVRFEAAEGNRVASVFGIRMIRGDKEGS